VIVAQIPECLGLLLEEVKTASVLNVSQELLLNVKLEPIPL
jgi:hypothetical protein